MVFNSVFKGLTPIFCLWQSYTRADVKQKNSESINRIFLQICFENVAKTFALLSKLDFTVWPVHGLALPKCPGTVAFPINIRLSDIRFASQFPTILFLYSPRFQLASASLPSFFFSVDQLGGRRTLVTTLHSAREWPPLPLPLPPPPLGQIRKSQCENHRFRKSS